jgi:hypothetical protein
MNLVNFWFRRDVCHLDSAYLHNSIFNLELKRRELEQQNMNRNQIIRWFENNYRVFSKKSAFTCLCCHKPVNMNLTKEDGRPFYFRHNDDTECAYSENTKTYEKHVSQVEDKSKKDIGLTVFREILEGELKPYKVEIERGFHYKKKLSFIPDFIIKFPNSNELWAVDYFTSINRGLTSGSYARHLSKRMKTYKEEGFKSFSFVDNSWLSFMTETNKGTLLTAETYVTSKTYEDHLWDVFLEENLQGDLLDFFMQDTKASVKDFNTKNIAYVDLSNRLCTIFRFIPVTQHERNITFYKLSSSKIPLAQALSLNTENNHFMLSEEVEDEKRNIFLSELIKKRKQFELEQRMLEEEQTRIRYEEEERQKQRQRAQELEDEQLEREMKERARRAALRPIEVHPDHWDHRTQLNNNRRTRELNYENIEDKIIKKKRERVHELLLSQPISGELYIDGDKKYWRLVILKWINENQSGDTLVVSLNNIIGYMKNSGVVFNQIDNLAKLPIETFLGFYVKTVKGELKRKIELTIM